MKAFAEIARKGASVEVPKWLVGEVRIDPKLLREWERIKKSYSLPEIVEMIKAAEPKRGPGAPIKAKTLVWIERLRTCKRERRGYIQFAQEYRPDLWKKSKELARAALRKFRYRHAKQIDS